MDELKELSWGKTSNSTRRIVTLILLMATLIFSVAFALLLPKAFADDDVFTNSVGVTLSFNG